MLGSALIVLVWFIKYEVTITVEFVQIVIFQFVNSLLFRWSRQNYYFLCTFLFVNLLNSSSFSIPKKRFVRLIRLL